METSLLEMGLVFKRKLFNKWVMCLCLLLGSEHHTLLSFGGVVLLLRMSQLPLLLTIVGDTLGGPLLSFGVALLVL